MANLMDRALLRYRIMAYIVGTMLLVLCVVALPLQYAFNHPAPAQVGFTIHGVFYMVYLFTVADLSRKGHFTPRRIAGLVAAGFVPGLAFVQERRLTAQLDHEVA
jgi:integral membrane protein